MRNIILVAATAVGVIGGTASGAMAQAGGSYLRTCTDVDQRGPYLHAMCRDGRGNYRPTQIDTRECGRFGNNNGRLVCEGGRPRGDDRGGYEGGRPRGDDRGGYDRGGPPDRGYGGGYERRPEGFDRPRY